MDTHHASACMRIRIQEVKRPERFLKNTEFICKISVAEQELEPEPVEPKLFSGAGAGTGAVFSNFGSGSAVPEPNLYF